MLSLKENPNNPTALNAILATVTTPGENFFVNLSLNKLEIIVHTQDVTDTKPANETGTLNSWCIIGQDAPNKESGNPRLTKHK